MWATYEVIIPEGELLLLDWIFCGQGQGATLQTQEELMRWRDLRERVWRGLLWYKLSNEAASVELSPTECEELLALVPTTFRGGTGEDVGFSLKTRLASELWGAEEQERHAKMKQMRAMFQEDQDANSPSPEPSPNTGANPAPAYDETDS